MTCWTSSGDRPRSHCVPLNKSMYSELVVDVFIFDLVQFVARRPGVPVQPPAPGVFWLRDGPQLRKTGPKTRVVRLGKGLRSWVPLQRNSGNNVNDGFRP